MPGDILLKMMSVMTLNDVRECKRLGLEAEVEEILDLWDGMVYRWAQVDASHPERYGSSGSARLVLKNLRAALRG
ncbi:hypothetical protein ES705_21020 [subsurface metagenome]